MWKHPWGYMEGAVICFGLFITGTILQLTVGSVNTILFQFPVNLIFAGIYWVCMLIMHLNKKRSAIIRWLSGMEASLTAIGAFLLMVLIMGLNRQTPVQSDIHPDGIVADIGFSQLTSSWSFLLIFLYMVTILLLTTLRKGLKFKIANIGFLLNHIGLSVVLWGAILGSGDMQRLHMVAQTGNPEWRASDTMGKISELPLAIQLEQFTIDEYPPKVMLIENFTGVSLPNGKPEVLSMENDSLNGKLLDWQLTGSKYLPRAAWIQGRYISYQNEGATAALYVKAKNLKSGAKKEGWVSYGSFMFPHQALELDNGKSLVMPPCEPKRFASTVTVFTKEGKSIPATIEVNKPLKVNGWKIYLLGYDESRGRWSKTCTFELVKDPWLPVVYTGIVLMLAGAFHLFLFTKTRRKKI